MLILIDISLKRDIPWFKILNVGNVSRFVNPKRLVVIETKYIENIEKYLNFYNFELKYIIVYRLRFYREYFIYL